MKRKSKLTGPSDAELRRLLERYKCPVPFHAIRTRFLGNIATPELSASPLQTVTNLWGEELPAFETEGDVNELVGGLVAGLWNRLTQHQDRKHPFHLTRMDPPRNVKELVRYAQVRVEELEGFIDGLFGDQESLDLPERAHQAVGRLADVRSFLNGYIQFADDPDLEQRFAETVRNLAELSRIAEKEVNAAVLSCTRAR